MSLDGPAFYQFLSGILGGDATLLALGNPPLSQGGARIYHDEAPKRANEAVPSVPTPFVLIEQVSVSPTQIISGEVIAARAVFLVEAVDRLRPPIANLVAICARIDALLTKANGTTAAGVVFGCVPDQLLGEFRRRETEAGGPYSYRLGRHWRLVGRAT